MDTMDPAEEQGRIIKPVNKAGATDCTHHHLAMAEPPPLDRLMPGFTPQQLSSLENMMNATISAALDERLGPKAKPERDSAIDLNDDDRPICNNPGFNSSPICNKNQPLPQQTPPADSLTIEMPGFAEEQVSSLEVLLNTTVKTALDARLGPQTTVGMADINGTQDGGGDDVDMTVDKNASPRGSQVNHLGVNGVEDGSRFAC